MRINEQGKRLIEEIPNMYEYRVVRTNQRRVKMRWSNFVDHFNFYMLTLLIPYVRIFKLYVA
jgi:hypothetical protein